MKSIIRQTSTKRAFTIVELLTVMSVIIILIGILVPALNLVKQYARKVRQKAQFHSIDVAMEFINAEWDGYPPSDAKDTSPATADYCGAMKFAEAMVGQDLLGFHPSSSFREDGEDNAGETLYEKDNETDEEWEENLRSRKGPYLPLENANAYRIKNLYGVGGIGVFSDKDTFVLCDVYNRVTLVDDTGDDTDDKIVGRKTGMPILYYRADTSGTKHPTKDNSVTIDDEDNIYNYEDNDELVKLKKPWDGSKHIMASDSDDPGGKPKNTFYENITNENISTTDRPYRADSYILLSAGFDGEYGTPDDIFNFGD